MSETVFDSVTSESEVKPTETPSGNELQVPTEMLEFIGDGRKYKTAEEALKSIPHAQVHIAKLEDELKTAREELGKRKTAEELIEEFRATGSSKPTGETTSQTTLEPNKLLELVNQAIETRENNKTAQQNASTVINAFVEKFGDVAKAKEQFVKLSEETGTPLPVLNKLAETSPKALLKLAGFENKPANTAASHPASTLNTEALASQPKAVDHSAIRVKAGASSKDVLAAWKAAGEAVKKDMGI